MSDKSYISIEQNICAVCGKKFDTNNLLIDKRLSARFDRHTVTGYGLCPEHQGLYDRGMIALVEVDNERLGQTLTMESANRTGRLFHVKSDVVQRIFNDVDIVGRGGRMLPLMFVEVEVGNKLQAAFENHQ